MDYQIMRSIRNSDYRDPLDTAPDYDGDDTCDDRDADDDNDGIDDIYDENCQFSPMDEEDYDNDGVPTTLKM